MILPTLEELQRKTNYRKPIEVGHYSKNEVGDILLNNRQSLSQYAEQQLPLDLNQGYPHDYIKRDPKPVRLDDLLIATRELESNVEFLTCMYLDRARHNDQNFIDTLL